MAYAPRSVAPGGAADFLLKPFTGEKVSQILKALFQQSSAMKLVAASIPVASHSPSIPISKREPQILLLLGKGYRQQEIANALNITLRTVKWHRASIKNKLGLNTLVEIARYCDQNKLLIEKTSKSPSN